MADMMNARLHAKAVKYANAMQKVKGYQNLPDGRF